MTVYRTTDGLSSDLASALHEESDGTLQPSSLTHLQFRFSLAAQPRV